MAKAKKVTMKVYFNSPLNIWGNIVKLTVPPEDYSLKTLKKKCLFENSGRENNKSHSNLGAILILFILYLTWLTPEITNLFFMGGLCFKAA